MRVLSQKGFTLIELMISLVLGLLIVAAVMQVYIMTIRTNTIQQSGSNIQNAGIFGIQKLEDALRVANLGNPTVMITNSTPSGGVVFGTSNIPGIADGVVTKANARSSNMSVAADQLTISYRNITGRRMSDCEGNIVEPDEMVAERYFLGGTAPNLDLRCVAVRVNHTGGVATGITRTPTNNISGSGSVFIANVDQFKILLGVQNNAQVASAVRIGYLTPTEYMPATTASTTTAASSPIVSVRVAIITRGGTGILGETSATSFNVFGASQTLNASATNQPQVRAVYETNVLLRNARAVYVTN